MSPAPAARPARVLVAAWPDWPVVAAGHPPEVAAAVVAANRVVAATAAARAEGVRTGLRRREAQGRCPELVVVPADPGRDARAWEPVVAAVEAMAPAVEVWGPGMLGVGTRGPSRYFGGDAALAGKVRVVAEEAAGAPGCRVGVADGRFAAALAARTAPAAAGILVVEPGAGRAWLAPRPVQALGPGYGDLADLLVRLGVRTLGDLADLPEQAVLGRFGATGVAAHRLARGLDERPVQGRTPPPDLACSAELDPPEERVEAAAFVAKALADELHARLGVAGLAATMVAIEVETEHGESLVRRWRHEGALSPSALAERARWQLDGWLSGRAGTSPTGGLTLLRLTPEEVRPDTGRQLDLWGGQADPDARAARAMARVQGMLGPEAVVTAVLEGGRGYAEQARLVPWGDAREDGREASARRRPDAGRQPPWPGRLPEPSPAVVHQPPRPADLVDLDGEVVRVSGRGAISAAPARLAVDGGAAEVVVRWAGPWPTEERWWDRGGRRRARLQVVLDSGEAHLVCRESGRWWVEASYA
ncbi:MAG TPA: DNA polymerase Y family protein [Acidimicrobiales bacterium]|nr:DNA polymerase Y family protein [Acidimicrobiales bacterium]